jgi:hypothetical protein
MSHTAAQQIYEIMPQLFQYAALRIMASPGFNASVTEVLEPLLQRRIVVGNLPPGSRPYKRKIDWDRVAAKMGYWFNHPDEYQSYGMEIRRNLWDTLPMVPLFKISRVLMSETANLQLTPHDRAQERLRQKEAYLGHKSSSVVATSSHQLTEKVVRLDTLTPQSVKLFNSQLRRFIDANYRMSQVLDLISESFRDSVLTNTFFTMGIVVVRR